MRIVMVSSLTPSGHYTQYILQGLQSLKDLEVISYAGIHEKGKVKVSNIGKVRYVWSRSVHYIIEILQQLDRDKPDVVHIQQEFNMYGGPITAALLPLLAFMIRLKGIPVVTTIHAAVYKRQITESFIKLFHQNSMLIRPTMLKLYFHFVYFFVATCSSTLVIHTKLKRRILTHDYGVKLHKITLVPIIIPHRTSRAMPRKPYMFYFGYMVRRKGLQYALEGFKKFIKKRNHKNFKLVLAGGIIAGQEKAKQEIIDFIHKNNLESSVIIKGFVEESELDRLYQEAYAVIIPAIISMGSSGPLFHAMSFGSAIITSDEGYFKEDISHLKTGFLTKNSEWDKAFSFIFSHPQKVSDIRAHVRQKAVTQSPKKVAKLYRNVYKAVHRL